MNIKKKILTPIILMLIPFACVWDRPHAEGIDAKSEDISVSSLEKETFMYIEVDSLTTFRIRTKKNTSVLEYYQDQIELPQEVNDFNFHEIIPVSLKGIDNVYAVRYNILGSSGLAASITYTTLIKVSEKRMELLAHYNSFLGEKSLLYQKGQSILLDVYKLEISDAQKSEFYCKTTFEFKGVFSPLPGPALCVFHKEDGILIEDKCSCTKLLKPDAWSR